MQETNPSLHKSRKAPKWEHLITVPDERKVFEALSDPNWDFRTVSGISMSTGMSQAYIALVLSKHAGLIRKSLVPDLEHRDLYTLSSRKVKGRELLGWARFLLSKSVG